MFSNPDPTEYTISPLGAAIVEAMPDRKKMAKIQRQFNESRKCTVSAIFKTQEEIDGYYAVKPPQESGG